MGGRVPFRGGHGGAGHGNKGRGSKGRGDKGRGDKGRGDKGCGDNGLGSGSRGSNPHLVSGTTPSALFKARKLQLLQLSQLPGGPPMPSDDEIYLEVVGGQNKDGDVYGIGSQGFSIANQGGLLDSEQPQVSVSVVQEIVQQFLTDFEQLNEERIGQRIGKEVESRITHLQTALLRVQDLVSRLPSLSEATHPAQGLEENPTNDIESNRDGNCMRDNIGDPSGE